MKERHESISMASKLKCVNSLDTFSAAFSKHVTDLAKYLEIHKLGASQRIEVKRRQEEVKAKLEEMFQASTDEMRRVTDSTLEEMIDSNEKLFDSALEYHSGETKSNIQYVQDKFSSQLMTCRKAHRAEIKDTIALDRALMKETMRETKRKHLLDIDNTKLQFKESIERMHQEKTDAMAMQMQLEAREKSFLKIIEDQKEERRGLIVKSEGERGRGRGRGEVVGEGEGEGTGKVSTAITKSSSSQL